MARGVDFSRLVMAAGFVMSAAAFAWESFGITSGAEFATFIGPEDSGRARLRPHVRPPLAHGG